MGTQPKKYRVDRRDLDDGMHVEMREHPTMSRGLARRTARQQLQAHPTFYQVMPVAEKMMEAREKNMRPIRKKRRPVPDRNAGFPPGFNSTPWG